MTLRNQRKSRYDQANPHALPGARDIYAPVAYCQTPVRSTPMGLCEAVLDFYGAPYGKNLRGRVHNLRESLHAHGTTALLLDDITRLKMHREDDQDTLDLIRDLMSLNVTLILIGIDIPRSGLLREGRHDPRTGQWVFSAAKPGKSHNAAAATQTERRFDLIGLDPFHYDTSENIGAWIHHLTGIEAQLHLFNAPPTGMLTTGDMPEYLFRRSQGIVGLLKRLIEDGCTKAMESEREVLDTDLLDEVTINLGNAPDRDPESGEVPAIPQASTRLAKPRSKRRNTVFDDPGLPSSAADAL